MTTKNATYANSGTMQDYLKFLIGDSEKDGNSHAYYRCYCTILHEYHDFNWFDKDDAPHIIDGCDSFTKYTDGSQETEESLHQHKKLTHDSSHPKPEHALKH